MFAQPRRSLFWLITILLILTQASCGTKLITASNGLGGGGVSPDDPNNPSKPSCEDLALNNIRVTLPALEIPANLIVSVNQGQVVYDACQSLAPGETPFVTVTRESDTRVAFNVRLWPDTPIRNYYFGNSSSVTPIRNDLALKISTRESCMGPQRILFSTTAGAVRWQKGTASDAECQASAKTYHGYLDIY